MTALRLLLLTILLWAGPAAYGQSFPALSGRVVDAADLLDPAQEAALTARLEALERQSGRQLVVATIPDLQGHEIGDFSYRLGRSWGIGDKERDDGTLLVVAPTERKVWIATGYGVEGVVTDALAARIYRTAIIPRFRQGDFPGGIAAGVDALATLLTLPPDEAKKQALAAEKENEADGGEIFVILFWVAVLMFIILPMLFGRRRGKRFRGGRAPVILWGPGPGSGSSGWGGGGSGWGSGGGFSGGGGSFGGGGAGGSW